MKTGLAILLLFLACSLKAPPLPPPPNRSAGTPPDNRMYFTNANHEIIVAHGPVPIPNFTRPTAKDFGVTNVAAHTNTPAQLALDPARQATLRRDAIGLFIVAGLIMFYVVWAGCRGSIFICTRQFVGFIDRQKEPVSFWIAMVIDFGLALSLIYLAIHEWRMLR